MLARLRDYVARDDSEDRYMREQARGMHRRKWLG
jgi:hypothetical protein